jgi:hypothetical protein
MLTCADSFSVVRIPNKNVAYWNSVVYEDKLEWFFTLVNEENPLRANATLVIGGLYDSEIECVSELIKKYYELGGQNILIYDGPIDSYDEEEEPTLVYVCPKEPHP